MTTAEKRSALAIHDAMRPKLDADAFRAACHASRETHGEQRHAVVKVAALHGSARQFATWRVEVAS